MTQGPVQAKEKVWEKSASFYLSIKSNYFYSNFENIMFSKIYTNKQSNKE